MSNAVYGAPCVPDEVREKILRCLNSLPPFSAVLRRVLATHSSDEDDISLPAIAVLMEKDTLISGKLLSIANSALYSRGREICSVQHALACLGINRVRNVILGLSVNRLWSGIRVPDEFSMLRFNQHALAAATACDLLVQRVPCTDPEEAFIAGLFHDVGQLVLVSMYPEQYCAALEEVPFDGGEFEEKERDLFGFTHAEVSAEVTAHWKLPMSVQVAVQNHEIPPEPRVNSEFHLSEIVHAADRYVSASGFCVTSYQYPDDAVALALQPLGVDDSRMSSDFFEQFSVFRTGL